MSVEIIPVESSRALRRFVDLPWQKYLQHDAAFDRPTEPKRLIGRADKIRKTLGWRPTGSFRDLVREMVEAELQTLNA